MLKFLPGRARRGLGLAVFGGLTAAAAAVAVTFVLTHDIVLLRDGQSGAGALIGKKPPKVKKFKFPAL